MKLFINGFVYSWGVVSLVYVVVNQQPFFIDVLAVFYGSIIGALFAIKPKNTYSFMPFKKQLSFYTNAETKLRLFTMGTYYYYNQNKPTNVKSFIEQNIHLMSVGALSRLIKIINK